MDPVEELRARIPALTREAAEEMVVNAQAERRNADGDADIQDFKCYRDEGRRGYATVEVMNDNYHDFCNKVDMDDKLSVSRSYAISTPEEHEFIIERKSVTSFDRDECRNAFKDIVHGCGSGPDNPMNWKFGGRLKKPAIAFEARVKRTMRPWPPPHEPYGTCEAMSRFHSGSHFKFRGAGYAGWDHGQQTILKVLETCLTGGRVMSWDIEYFDKPDEDGYEWEVNFAVLARMEHLQMCGGEKHLIAAAGGLTGSCWGLTRKWA
ncbi:hypothetical protein OQA88_12979 [Cercophora sp. LCS_1]